MTVLILGLILFLGSHTFTRAQTLRANVRGRLGEGPFKGLYSLIALAGFILIIVGYGQYRSAGYVPVWTPPEALKHLAYLLLMPVFVLLISAYVPGKIKASVGHPMLAAVTLWAGAHLLVNGDLGSILLFGGFLVWSIFARVLQAKTERVPVAWSWGDAIAILGGLGAWVVTLLWLHPIVIGVSAVG